jgi:hypothetical protein
MKLKEQQAGLAIKNQPQKTQKYPPKTPLKMFFLGFLSF